ncbi:MAG: signal peptidase II [Candidatus Rokubacteria bacterium]|nr:signal peptidase II [Candidatus Rokubacteria bacterium]
MSAPARTDALAPARMIRVAALATTIVVVDQITKFVVLEGLPPGVRLEVVDGLVAFTLVMNPGLAFGLLANLPVAWRWVVAALSIAALGVLARVALRILPGGGWLDLAAIGLIFGGAVGNLIDRARFGAVIDFIDVYYRSYTPPRSARPGGAVALLDVALGPVARVHRRAPHTPPAFGTSAAKPRPSSTSPW